MDNWRITESAFDPKKQSHKETVFTIGNGYLGVRGTFEEGFSERKATTLIHGVFNDVPVYSTELVNVPNWLDFNVFVNGERFRTERGKVLLYQRELDLRTGVLTRKVRWQSPKGETLDLEIERFASMADEHVLGIRCRATAVNFSGTLEFRAGIPGHVENAGWVHLEWNEQGRIDTQSAYLEVQTRATKIKLCEAIRLALDGVEAGTYEYWDTTMSPTLTARINVKPGEQVTAEKLVAVFTSRDTQDPKAATQRKLAEAAGQGYRILRQANDAAWAKEWERCNILIEGDDEADRALRYSLFQLLIAAPRHDNRVSIPAKSLSGYGYRGHIFWDTEVFILPFLIYTRPEIARNLLTYRYHTLPGAREKARANGYEGAMYAWESAATGAEMTPRWMYGPDGSEMLRIWCGDIEHHITADVSYAVCQYWQVTGDDEFMRDYGAEIILDTARFWGSRAEWNEAKGRYEVNNVIGPDEYHDHVDNNAYTNNLARWNLRTAFVVLDWLRKADPRKAKELEGRLDLSPQRLAHWRDVRDRLYLGFDPQTELFEQFEGFFKLKNADLNSFEPRTKSMQAILGIEGVQAYQVIKQPDVLMLLYLLRDEYDIKILKKNWSYYNPRTDLTYGSSLGPAIHAALSARLGDISAAYHHFIHAARTDLEDVRGNTADGIHAATNGGLWQAVVFGFGGLGMANGKPAATPRLPDHWKRLKFRIQYHGKPYDFDLWHSAGETTRSPRPPVLGTIFDLDGVLTDTSELHYLAWQRLADEEGIPFSRQENEALRGIPRRESLLLLLKGRPYPEEALQEMMDRKNRYYVESIARLTPKNLLPDARRFLEDLRQAGVKIAIGSASKNAWAVVERLGIVGLVDAISDGHSVTRQKPEPDLFLHAAAQLGLPPEQCVIFEDAEAGVAAGLAGGMWVVGIGPHERVGAAHVILPNLKGVTWPTLLEQLTQAHSARLRKNFRN